jgi:hypothetical protein
MALDRRLWAPLLIAVFLIVQVWAAVSFAGSDREPRRVVCEGGSAASSHTCFR